jgi:hypothetical protein
MSNLTFDEKLVRECKAEPLEGHTVVVLERVGQEGEKFHSLLEPGAERPRQNPFAALFGKPNIYVAYAVDASKGRSLNFTEHVQMAERVHDFVLHFSLWYRVGDPQLLVANRTSDPLETVRKRVAEVVTEEMAEQPWSAVWHAFRSTSETVVASTTAELKAFARDFGITITTLRLRADFPENALRTDREIHEIQQSGRVGVARIDVAAELQNHRRAARRAGADHEQVERAEEFEKKMTDAMRDRYVELIRSAGSDDEVREIMRGLASLTGSIGGAATATGPRSIAAGNGHAPHALPPAGGGGTGLGAVLADVVALSECRPDGTCRRLRSRLLHLVAEAVADDSTQVSPELAKLASQARDEIDSASLPADRVRALQELADPQRLRQRL